MTPTYFQAYNPEISLTLSNSFFNRSNQKPRKVFLRAPKIFIMDTGINFNHIEFQGLKTFYRQSSYVINNYMKSAISTLYNSLINFKDYVNETNTDGIRIPYMDSIF